MDNPNLALFISGQFPEMYREEFPQIITFMEKYYEFLGTTETGRVENLRNIDASLNAFIEELKSELSKNVPSFGMVSDADFLRVAKQFYLSRGSEDSFKFLMRAMFGKSVDFIYPGNSILKASDGRWIQEVSVRVQVSGPITDIVSEANIRGNRFILKKDADDLGSLFLSTNVKRVTDTVYDIFLDRSFRATIEEGDIFEYTTNLGVLIPGVVLNAVISGVVLNGGPGAAVLTANNRTAFFAGSAFIIPGVGPDAKDCIIRVTSMDPEDATRISVFDVIAQGNGFSGTMYACLRPQARSAYMVTSVFGDFTNLVYNPGYQIGDAYVRIDVGPLMRFRGFYSTTNGFLSDDIKLQDGNYYQTGSYVLRLDEQLASYKSAVKTLLHPDGMALWGQYDLQNTFSVPPILRDAVREFLQLLQDVTRGVDVWSHATTSSRSSVSSGSDIMVRGATKVTSDPINSSDSGQLIVLAGQNYTTGVPSYFAGVSLEDSYTAGPLTITRTW